MTSETDLHGYILIVDDLDENLQVLGNILMENNYDVAAASSGDEALDILREEENLPNLILLDVMMPNKNGWDTCREIKLDPKMKDIPVIFLTAKAEVEDVVSGFDAGGVDYVTKPFNPKDLLVRVKTHIELQYARKKLLDQKNSLEKAYTRINDDLKSAQKYISSIIPPPLTEGSIKAYWEFLPTESLGGDTFGYHFLDEDSFAFYIIDVSGHGVSSALLSVSQINAIRFESLPDTDFHSPKQVLSKLNEVFDMKDNNYLYCTMFYGVYNKKTRVLKYASGGHPPALLINRNDKTSITLDEQNIIVGAIQTSVYAETEIFIEEDTALYLYTDGAFEVIKDDDTPHSFLELHSYLQKNADSEHKEIRKLYKHLLKLSNNTELDDDFTILKFIFY